MVSFLTGRPNAKSSGRRAVRPSLEGLEDRMLLYAVTGDHFNYGSRITWSLMPDGTPLGSFNSNLISTLNNQLGPQSTWLPRIADAFAQWEAVANVNFAQVSDDGEPFDNGNIQQDSPNFGDIRIGGMAQGSNVLAFAMLPPAANGGSDSGDVLFNTAQSWHIGSDYDFETVLVHEIGHALGMAHSASPTAVMYPYYTGVQDYPTADDVQGVDAIWGPRQEDGIAQPYNNHTFAAAFNLNNFVSQSNYQAYVPFLDVVNPSESYWFKVTTPYNASNVFTAQVQSTGISELSPRVQIYNAAYQGLMQTSASAQAYGATINATITNATPNTTYYVRVLASNAGDTGAGGYVLTLNMGYQFIGNAYPPNTLVYVQPDQGGGAILDQIGGGNTRANTAVDLPDWLDLGTFNVQGDALTTLPGKHADVRHGVVHVNRPHPGRTGSEKPVKGRAKAARSIKH